MFVSFAGQWRSFAELRRKDVSFSRLARCAPRPSQVIRRAPTEQSCVRQQGSTKRQVNSKANTAGLLSGGLEMGNALNICLPSRRPAASPASPWAGPWRRGSPRHFGYREIALELRKQCSAPWIRRELRSKLVAVLGQATMPPAHPRHSLMRFFMQGPASANRWRGRCMTNVQLSCGGNVGWTKGAHANKPKGSFLESNPFGFSCGGFAARERTVMSDAQRLVPGISAANDHQNQHVDHRSTPQSPVRSPNANLAYAFANRTRYPKFG